MNKKSIIKKITGIILSIMMVMSFMPIQAFADGTYTFPSMSQSGDNDSTLRYYLTDENAGDITISQQSGYVYLGLALDDGWYFDHWDTYFNGYEDVAVWEDDKVQGSNPVNDEGYYTFYNRDGQKSPFINASGPHNTFIHIAKGTGFYGDHKITAVLKPILTVNAGEGVTYQVETNNPSYTKLAENQVAVEYGDNATITYTVDNKYIVTGVSANYGTNYSNNGNVVTVSSIVKPATIDIKSRLKQQKVSFDANGGEGTMSTQVFEHSVAQALTANVFKRTGYTFAGWNTKADGTGTAYADKQSATLTPENDGDSITLYAQWTECKKHQWEDGVCAKCGAVCSHSGGTATCTEQANCEICHEKYGKLAKHNVVYDDSNNRIVETCTAGCNHVATATIEHDTTVNTVYNGSTIEALTVLYSDGWQGGKLEIAYSNNKNAGMASGTISIGNATATAIFEITKATADTLETPTAQNKITYGAKLSTVGLNGGWLWENGDIVPSVNNNGYMAYYIPSDITNYDWTKVDGWNATTNRVERTIAVTVDKAPLTITANDKTIVYSDVPANNSVTYCGFVNGETKDVLGGTPDLSCNYSQYDDVGTYKITPSGLTSNNYDIIFEEGNLTVEPKELTITWGNSTFIYDQTEKFPEFVVDGIVMGDDIQLTRAGAATNAQNEHIGVITGITGADAENYKLPDNVTKEFSIEKATPDLGNVSVSGVVYDTTAPADVALTQTGTVEGRFEITDSAMLANKTTYDYRFVPEDTDNYNSVAGQVKINVQDTAVPSVSIQIDNYKWTLWDTITFGAFYNSNKEVKITYTDNENGSGLKESLYFVANREYTEDELQSIEWKEYNGAFDIEPDGKYVVYAKATDNCGNGIVVNSNGLILDKTNAVVGGITDGGIYYGQVVFTTKDELAGIKAVEVDGADLTNFEGQYVIDPDNAEHTIIVTDHAGNVAEYKITVYKNYIVTFLVDGEVLSTENVGYGMDATLPTVPIKDGYTGKWNRDGKNITADTEIKAIYTENTVAVYDRDVQSSQTGDNSNVALWFAILFISGCALIAITVNERKRKHMD